MSKQSAKKESETSSPREIRNVGLGAGAGALAAVGVVVAVEMAPVALVGAAAGVCVYGFGRLCSWW